jgi:dihydroorotase
VIKKVRCGCAGCFSSPFAIELYAEVFDRENKMDKLEDFSSTFGEKFYDLEPNKEQITLIRKPFKVVQEYEFAGKTIVPYGFGDSFAWSVD